ncbi:L-xylo-3-hexulose reductase [Fusarium kuroshium]|uniref:L-xylo-3-hexulose reductase n=1 Tax=Fusarium kuroshium TaxID=2010991 RepID=A0A3M2SHJ6_9HYPO|nr:L-xylo-3-hexulose reductase [Fusarium kuroshium]
MTQMTVERPLQGKLAIVTGAFRGIGAAITKNLAAKGAHVLGVYDLLHRLSRLQL